MSLLLLGDPKQASLLIQHLIEAERLDKIFQQGKGSRTLEWASKVFNPKIRREVPPGCTGAVILMDLVGIYFQHNQFHIDFSKVTRCIVIQQASNLEEGSLPTSTAISANCGIPKPGCYPITATVNCNNGHMHFHIERFDWNGQHTHLKP